MALPFAAFAGILKALASPLDIASESGKGFAGREEKGSGGQGKEGNNGTEVHTPQSYPRGPEMQFFNAS